MDKFKQLESFVSVATRDSPTPSAIMGRPLGLPVAATPVQDSQVDRLARACRDPVALAG